MIITCICFVLWKISDEPYSPWDPVTELFPDMVSGSAQASLAASLS